MKPDNLLPSEHIKLPTEYGTFEMVTFQNSEKGGEPPFALISGEINPEKVITVRVHSECLTGDMLHSLRCDCGNQLKKSLYTISEEGGVLIYLRQEGRGIGLTEKIKTYRLQENGADTVEANLMLGHEADLRNYSEAAGILNYLNIKKIKLLTNNPDKIKALSDEGFDVSRQSIMTEIHEHNIRYLSVKKNKMGQMLSLEDGE